MKPEFKKNDVFFHKEAKRFFIIDSLEESKGSWLYALFSPNAKGKNPDWKRCYEVDILRKYIPVENTSSEMVKILFGN